MDLQCGLNEYLFEMNKFIEDMQAKENLQGSDIYKGVIPIFKMLRIGSAQVTVETFAGPNRMNKGQCEKDTLFHTEEADMARAIDLRRATGSENKFTIKVCPIIGESDWSDDELYCINSVVSIIYTFISKAKLADTTYKLVFTDMQFHMPNVPALERDTYELFAEGESNKYASCRFDFKNTKSLNSMIGVARANEIIGQFVHKLDAMLSINGTVYRIGGDNFYIIFKKDCFEMVRDYLLGQTITTNWPDAPEIIVETHAGYYLDWDSNSLPDRVMAVTHRIGISAHMDQYHRYLVADAKAIENYDYSVMVTNMFQEAIDKEEFLVYYQPKYDSETEEIVGAEALCRWLHDKELIPPGRFIPVLEQGTQICALDYYMLEHVCKDIKEWVDAGITPPRVSVNLSRVHLGNKKLADSIAKIIEKYGISSEYVEIELTETTTDVNYQDLKKLVTQLSNNNIHTSVDDFGIGYSSLNILKDMPWDVLKIDRGFLPVEGDEDISKKKVILKNLINMANDLGLLCLAEGAETKEQVDLLKEYGCKIIQGFYYSKPMPKEQYTKMLI